VGFKQEKEMNMSPIDFVRKFSAMGYEPFTADELVAAQSARLIGYHGPNGAYQLTELGVSLLETRPSPAFWQALSGPAASSQAAKDVQVGGDHYKTMGDYQPWQVLAEWMTPEELRGYMKGTVIAYLAREKQKGGDQDIGKALHTMRLFEGLRKDKSCK